MPSLFEAAGNVLDLPGSSIRDLLMMRNPVDQYLTPFSADNRTSGQEMLHSVGMSGDSPWLSAGLEMALDPSSLLGLGMLGKSLKMGGKIGALRKAFGTADDAARTLAGLPSQVRNAFNKVRGAVTRKGMTPEEVALKEVGPPPPRGNWLERVLYSEEYNDALANARARPPAQTPALARALIATVYNPRFRQGAGGAALLESLMRGRELNPYHDQMYDEQAAGIQ